MTYYVVPEVTRAKASGDNLRAAEVLDQSLETLPSFVEAMSEQNPPRGNDEVNFARMASKAELDCADAYTSAARPDLAKRHSDRAAQLRLALEAAQRSTP